MCCASLLEPVTEKSAKRKSVKLGWETGFNLPYFEDGTRWHTLVWYIRREENKEFVFGRIKTGFLRFLIPSSFVASRSTTAGQVVTQATVMKFSPNLSLCSSTSSAPAQVNGVAVQPPGPGILGVLLSRLFSQVYVTGAAPRQGTDVSNDNNFDVFVSKRTDSHAVAVFPWAQL